VLFIGTRFSNLYTVVDTSVIGMTRRRRRRRRRRRSGA